MAPPEANRDVTSWKEQDEPASELPQAAAETTAESSELDALRQRLEGLL